MTLRPRPRTLAALCAISTLCLAGNVAATPAAFADATSTIGLVASDAPQSYPADHLALHWGIRPSFNSYIGGPTHLLDGAKYENNTYVWPYLSTTVDGDTVSYNYGGTVNFQKYCKDPDKPERGACDLDLTFTNPQVVINTSTHEAEVRATVHTVDYGSKEWSGPETVVVATAQLESGKYNFTPVGGEKAVTWRGVTTTLTEAGNKAFSNFYDAGQALDNLDFSYPGDQVISTDVSGYTVGERLLTNAEWGDANSVITAGEDRLVQVSAGYTTTALRLIDTVTNTVVASEDIDAQVLGGDVVYNPATNEVYYPVQREEKISDDSWQTRKLTVVKARTVSASGFGAARDIIEVPGRATGFALNPVSGRIAVLTPGDTNTLHEVDPATGDDTATTLPDAQALYGLDAPAPHAEPYGSLYFRDGASQLRALPDGTYVYVFGTSIVTGEDGKDGVYAQPLHITPAATPTAATIDSLASDFQGKHSIRGVRVSGDQVAFYNTLSDSSGSAAVKAYRYTNGTFTPGARIDNQPWASSIAGVTFSPAGDLVVIGASTGTATFVDPTTGQVKNTAVIGSTMKDTSGLHDDAVFDTAGNLYLGEIVVENYEEFYSLVTLTPPAADGSQRKNTITPVLMDTTLTIEPEPEPTTPEPPTVTTPDTPTDGADTNTTVTTIHTTLPTTTVSPAPAPTHTPSDNPWFTDTREALLDYGVPKWLSTIVASFTGAVYWLFSPLANLLINLIR